VENGEGKMARLRRAVIGVLFGVGCLLAACSAAAAPPAEPPQRVQIGCFRPLDVTPVADTPAVTQMRAEEVAQTFYEGQNGAVLPRYVDGTGKSQIAPPFLVQSVHIQASDYGSSGEGGAGGSDPLRGRTVWIMGYTIERAAIWSPYRGGQIVSIIVDGQTPVPLLTCARPGT
jgi:hypothetical protein